MSYMTVAMPKGRLLEPAARLLSRCGMPCMGLLNGRGLVVTDDVRRTRYLLVRPSDVPVYVEAGAAEVGVVGKDVLEEQRRNLIEALDLGIGSPRR